MSLSIPGGTRMPLPIVPRPRRTPARGAPEPPCLFYEGVYPKTGKRYAVRASSITGELGSLDEVVRLDPPRRLRLGDTLPDSADAA